MDAINDAIDLEPPRFEERKSFLLAGLVGRYNTRRIEGIPAQWGRFGPYIGKVPGQVAPATYGVCFNFDGAGNMDYLCGVEISGDAALSEPLAELRIAERRYAVFRHRDDLSKIRLTWRAIFGQWAPTSGYTLATAPQLEVYTDGVEIWIPLEG